MNDYILQVGREGADRLRLLARAKWPTTKSLLRQAGLSADMRCLDVGCGPGEVSLRLARWVGPQGLVVGLDVDEAYLAQAREAAERRHLPAVFRRENAYDLTEEAVYDLVYARFLLTHLPRPEEVLARLVRAVRPGGVVVLEDGDFAGHFSHPACPALDRYVTLYRHLLRGKGGDADIGPRLPGLLDDAGLRPVHMRVLIPAYRTSPCKYITPITMAHIREPLIAAGLATAAEVDQIVGALNVFAADPRTILSIARIFQVWARRPQPG